MRMKRILTAVAFFMAILTVGSSAWALSYSDHVSVAPNGQGDLLYYPIFVTTDGWTSRVSVVNTSKYSVVAKLVVRSGVFSQELLDFLIYLSPYDMWYGFIQYTATGPKMYSTDSSVVYGSGIRIIDDPAPFATEAKPMNIDFAKLNCTQDTNLLGYIEVIKAWTQDIIFTSDELADKQLRGKRISAEYLANPFTPMPLNVDEFNVLAGAIDIDVEAQGLSMTTSTAAVALKDYQNQARLVAENPTYVGEQSNNNLQEVEAVLSKKNIAMPYVHNDEGESLHLFTFPTKQSVTSNSCVYVGPRASIYFSKTSQNVTYKPEVFDNDERMAENPFSPPRKNFWLPNEFNFLVVSDVIFKQGWINYVMTDTVAGTNKQGKVLAYTGAPVLPLVLDFRAGFALKTPSDVDGVVSGEFGAAIKKLNGYHYTSSYSVT